MSRRLLLVVLSVVSLAIGSIAGVDSATAAAKYCVGASALVNHCSRPFAVPDDFDAYAAAHDKGSLGMPCSARATHVITCTFGDTKTFQHTVAVVGNSHAGHLIGALDAYGKTHRIRVMLMRKTGCTGAVEKAAGWSVGPHRDCFTWTHNVLQKIRTTKAIDAVVFASSNDSLRYIATASADKATRAKVTQAIQSTLRGLFRLGKAVLVFGDTPGFYPYTIPACVQKYRDRYDPCSKPASIGAERGNYVAHAAKLTRGIQYRSITKYFCDSKKCHVVIGGEVVHLDEHHLTNTYSRSLAPYLGASLSSAIRAR